MKKLLALILAAALVFSLAACGGDSGAGNTNTPSGGGGTEDTSAPTQDTPSDSPENSPEPEKMIPGSYVPVGLLPGTDYEVNENGSYDHGEEKGTYTAAEDGSLTFQSKEGRSSTLTACGAYYHTAVQMAEDTEYGLAPSFDESGHSNQTFQTKVDDMLLTLELHEDGSYVFSYSKTSPVFDKFSDVVTCEGSYALEDAVLNLNYNDNLYHFLFADDVIYPIVYVKKTDMNSADVEAAQAAVLTVEAESAQGRWWTPADETTAATITAALVGTWKYSDGYGNYQLSFSETGVSVRMDFMGISSLSSSGTYSVTNGAILLEYQSQSGGHIIINHQAVPYTYTDGSLALYEMLDMMNEKGLRDAAADLTAISSYQYQKTN